MWRKMKKMIVIIFLLFITAGCGEMTPYQRQVWGEAFQNISQMQHEQNLAKWQYSQPQIVYPRQQQNNSTYWQEQYYQDKVWEKNHKLVPTPKWEPKMDYGVPWR